MQKFRMQFAAVLLCSAVALAWATDKTRQKPGNEREQDKEVVRRVFDDLFNSARLDVINQIYSPNCVIHHGRKNMNVNEVVSDGKEWRSAAPDMRITVEGMNVEKDRVTVRWIARGTNTGRGHGLSASGKPVVVHGNSAFRLENGKIAEQWNNFNEEEIFRQVGQNPGKHEHER